MSSRRKISEIVLVVFTALLMAACAETDSTNKVPVANDPSGGSTTPIVPSNPTGDNRLPDQTRAAQIFLTNNTDYSDLETIFNESFSNVIGMPFLILDLTGGASASTVTGTATFGLEMEDAVIWATLPATELAGTRTSSYLDAIYSDGGFTLRVTGNLVSGKISQGNVYYRMRGYSGSGMETQCLNITCKDWSGKTVACTTQQKQNVAQTCRNYMFEGNPGVRSIGTYRDFDYKTKWIR